LWLSSVEPQTVDGDPLILPEPPTSTPRPDRPVGGEREKKKKKMMMMMMMICLLG
jgi:hypothetical protein